MRRGERIREEDRPTERTLAHIFLASNGTFVWWVIGTNTSTEDETVWVVAGRKVGWVGNDSIETL